MARRYEIEIAPTGYRSLQTINDKKARGEIARVIDGLAQAPEEQGKALLEPLEGVRSVRAARGRFRILYKVDTRVRLVSVLLVGRRAAGKDADVYALAQKLLAILRSRGEEVGTRGHPMRPSRPSLPRPRRTS